MLETESVITELALLSAVIDKSAGLNSALIAAPPILPISKDDVVVLLEVVPLEEFDPPGGG